MRIRVCRPHRAQLYEFLVIYHLTMATFISFWLICEHFQCFVGRLSLYVNKLWESSLNFVPRAISLHGRKKKLEKKQAVEHTKYRTNIGFHLNLFQINWFWLAFGFNIASIHSANMVCNLYWTILWRRGKTSSNQREIWKSVRPPFRTISLFSASQISLRSSKKWVHTKARHRF